MRNLFWILLLGNVILFAVMRNGGFGWGEQDVLAQPALHSEMIRLLPAPQIVPAGAMRPSRSVPAPAVVSHPSVSPSKPDPLADTAAPSKPDDLVCLEWGDFSGPDLVRSKAALSALKLDDKLSHRQIEQDIGYWVYFPSRSKAEVKRKIAEIKDLGIKDYFVMQGKGQWHNAISLGVFKTREAAQHFLKGMHAKGVRTARVGARASKLRSTIFMLHGVDAATVSKLTALQNDFPGSTLNIVPCALTR